MVSDEKLKQWVRDKMEQGVSEDRIKKSLEETGHDPSIVDRVQNPFENEESSEPVEETREEFQERGKEREDFKFGGEDEPFEEETGSRESSGDEEEQKQEFQRPDTSDIKSAKSERQTEDRDDEGGGGMDLDFEMPDIPPRAVRIAGVAVLILLVGAALLTFGIPTGAVPEVSLQGSTEDVSTSQSASPSQNCDVGVRVNSIDRRSGSTVVEATVFNGEANTTMQLYDQDGMVASESRMVSGTTSFSFGESGYLAVFKPVGCGFEDRLTTG